MLRPQNLKTAGVPSLLVALLIVTVSVVFSYRTWASFNRSSQQAARTRQVVDHANALLSSLKDAETGERGFVLTGRDQYLEPYRQALKEVPVTMDSLTVLAGTDSRDQAQRIDRLRLLVNAKLEVSQRMVELRQAEGRDAAIAAVLTNRGKTVMDQIRALCSEITAVSDRRLTEETGAAQNSSYFLGLLTTVGSAVLILILILSTLTIQRVTHRREELIHDLQRNQELLTTFVRYVPAAVAMLDRDMRYIEVSDRWSTEYQLGDVPLSGRSHYEVFPDIPERWKDLHRRGLAGEILRAEDDCFERAGGLRTWLCWEIRPWGHRDGLPEGILIFSEDITRRKEAEETLRDQHDRLEKIVATAPGAICTFRLRPDGSTSLPYASPGFRKILPELPDLQHDAAPLFAMMHPADVERIRLSVAESARLMTPWRDSYRLLTPARGAIWVEGHSIPTREPDGSVCWYGSLTEVTERKRMEESLLQAKREYRTLIDHSPDAIVRVDRECRHLFVNARLLEVTGIPEEAFIGKRADEVGFPPNINEPWLRAIRRVIATGRPEGSEFSYPTRAGETHWQIRMIPEFAPDGSVQSVLAIGLDITERLRSESLVRQSEEEAREQESIIATLFDTASQAILGVGGDGRIRLVNRMVEELFGYEQKELLGAPMETLLPLHLRQMHVAHRESFASAPRNRPMGLGLELQGCRKDGSEFPIEVSLSYVHTRDGFLAVSFITDITVRKMHEFALVNGERELRKLSSALIVAGEEAAGQIARELHDDITQRLAFLSMEIGTTAAHPPVAEELVRGLRSYQAKIFAISEGIRKISHQMHPSILDDLGLGAALESMCLDLERVEGMPIHFVARDVPEAIDRTVALCLYRITQESLRNVSKHARASDVTVALTCEGEWLELAILDSGVGFDPATRKEGLGTHSMKERARLANGTLSIDSLPGEGTHVTVRVPVKGEQREARAYSAGM